MTIWPMTDLRPVFYLILHVLLCFLMSNTTYYYNFFEIYIILILLFWLNYTYIHGNIGYKRVQTGSNGCRWVRMGALGYRGHGGHKNKASRVHLWSCRSGFGPYGRGNFPGHHVLGGLVKSVKNGWRWVQTGSDGCNRACDHGEDQKQEKKMPKWVSSVFFCRHGQGKKMQHVAKGDCGAQRGSREEQRGCKGGH